MAVQVQVGVWGTGVGVGVHVPAAARVAPQHRASKPDEQQRDEEIRGGGEAGGEVQPPQHDQPHDNPDARRVPHRPGEPEPARRPDRPLPGRERGHGGQVVGLEGVAEAEQQPDANQGEDSRGHRGPKLSDNCNPLSRHAVQGTA